MDLNDVRQALQVTGCEIMVFAGAERLVAWQGDYTAEEWLARVCEALEVKRQAMGNQEYIEQRQTLEARGAQAFDQGQLVDTDPNPWIAAPTASGRFGELPEPEGD